MLGSYDRLLVQSKSIHEQAKRGYWDSVYTLLRSNPGLGYHPDPNLPTTGWSLTDHAVYQRRIGVILTLRQQFKLRQSPQSCVVFYHIGTRNWPLILGLLNGRILSANAIYLLPNGERATLLDLAALNGEKDVVKNLRYGYAAKTAQELDVAETTKKMFIAAKDKQWSVVFKMIAEGIVDIDSVDCSTTNNATLLHYAYEQRDQAAFLKLIDKYHASLHEIRNEDKVLYELLLDFYDQCIYERNQREEEQLIKQFNQTLGKFDNERETKDLFAPTRPFVLSPLLTSSSPAIPDEEVVGIRGLNPENDEIIQREIVRRPWS